MAERGLLGMNVPRAYGGSAAGPVAYALSVMEIAEACASTAVLMTTNNLVGEILATFGSEEQKEQHLGNLVSGRYVSASFALSEPDAGSDAGAIRTQATRLDGSGYRLDGQKQWTTSGAFADLLVVWARSGAAGLGGLSCFLVDPRAPGLTIGPPEGKLGLRASNTVSLTLDGVTVPSSAVLGGIGRGFKIAMSALDGGRIGIASQSCGIAGAALKSMTRCLRRSTPAGDGLPASHSALADAATELEAARLHLAGGLAEGAKARLLHRGRHGEALRVGGRQSHLRTRARRPRSRRSPRRLGRGAPPSRRTRHHDLRRNERDPAAARGSLASRLTPALLSLRRGQAPSRSGLDRRRPGRRRRCAFLARTRRPGRRSGCR